MNPTLLELDGAAGGGQILRTALSLSVITGRAFRMKHIRGARPKPGLMRQHLACVKGAAEISSARIMGADIGSTEITFVPKVAQPGSYEFGIGTAGSTGLLLQTLLPVLWRAGGDSELRLRGGTHNPLAPCTDFLRRIYLSVVGRMGFHAELDLVCAGFAPIGGGEAFCRVTPASSLQPLVLLDRGALKGTRLHLLSRGLGELIPQRVWRAVQREFPVDEVTCEDAADGLGQGICCMVEAEFEHHREMFVSFGEMALSSEAVGKRAASAMQQYVQSGVAVGRHTADQLLLPMALAGSGEFTTQGISNHVKTNIAVIEKFLPVKFHIIHLENGRTHLRCES
jgi:RNA 3'-terminal phosphate cyclase (ATP)